MPGNKFSKEDFADQSFFDALIKADKLLTELLKTFKEMGKEARAVSKAIKGAKTFEQLTRSANEAEKATARFSSTEKKIIKNIQAVRLASTEEGKAIALTNEKKRRATKANRDWAKSQLGAEKATRRLWKSVAAGNIVANVFTRIIRGIGRALRNTVKRIADFDQAIADVGAIAEASNQEMERFRKTALALGGTTKFTATEVAGLQKELAKLGFTTSEIIASQAAILSLAAAAKTDLARAAEVAGITVRQFGLTADETGRVVDVMSKSFTDSALDIEKFAEAMKFVGPAAKVSGLSIEQATARLEQLANAGISGSMAGTSLRNIMLGLSKESGTFSEKIERAAEKGLDLAEASEEVQRRAAVALLVLADGVDTVDDFTEALENSAGAAKELAERQLDTLRGQVTILASAWDRLTQSVLASETGFRGIKGFIAGFSSIMNNYVDASEALSNIGISEAEEFQARFLEDLVGKNYDQQVKALGEEVGFITKELNNYKQELSEANFQLANTKKREKDVREEWTRRQGVAEGMIRIYENYLQLLKDVQIEESQQTTVQVFEDISEQIKKIKADETKFLEEDNQGYIQDVIDMWGEVEDQSVGAIENLGNILDAKLDSDIDRLKTEADAKDEQHQREIEQAEELRDIKIAAANAAFDLADSLVNRKIQKLEFEERREIESLEARAEAGIITTEQLESKKAQIEKKAAAESLKLRRQQAAFDKAQALFNIAINTAIAATKVASQTGVGAAVAVPLIIAFGALQAAAVVAEPLPQFAEGTESSPGGPAWVGEKGPELGRDPSGKLFITPGKSTLMNLRKGTEIVPADITNELLKYSYIASAMPEARDSEILMMMSELKGIKQAIKSKPVASSTLTTGGILTATHRGNTTIKKLDKFFK